MRRALLTCLLAATAVAVTAGPATAVPAEPALAAPTAAGPTLAGFTLPRPTGPHPVGTTELHLVQHGRADPWVPDQTRELMISVWYPAQRSPRSPVAGYLPPDLADHYAEHPPLGLPAGRVDWRGVQTQALTGAPVSGAGYPVVLYSPGVGVSRALGTVLVAELASRGYVVVTVDHTHETEVAFPGGRVEPTRVPFDQPDTDGQKSALLMDSRDQDIRFVLDQLTVLAAGGNPDAEQRRLPSGLGRALDMANVGMFGHSGGGVTTGRVMYADRRVDAGINMEGFLEFGNTRPENGVDRPILMMGARSHEQQPPLYGKPRTHLTDPSWATFWAHSTGWKLDLNVPDGRHYTFTDAQWFLPQLAGPLGIDNQATIGTVDPVRITAAERAYTAAFFDQHLKHRPQPLLTGPSACYPDVSVIR
ncbi:alpha/beta hydrolase family protein [Goodfellowiella coeruleoviolacea]|uniref:Alpha/beta hydrolase family protein n=1 Tax=Goodfellowiella coeruleoviolacea TaxID=334858 RepID=A0AAE3GLI7_9PSEU|nr:lipase [Goodfellowiella coeruleoviolacea]MCP2170446.1 Alpha/beta hydrolase family protein [Goodfellowiella coeruleoviolacea]